MSVTMPKTLYAVRNRYTGRFFARPEASRSPAFYMSESSARAVATKLNPHVTGEIRDERWQVVEVEVHPK